MCEAHSKTDGDDPYKLIDEEGRLAALARYGIIDTPREQSFDKITALVRDILEVPICAVTLLERDRQWIKSIQGLDVTETPRDLAFCHYTIMDRKPMVVPDATHDPRFSAHPAVVGDPGVRSYAGVPLRTPDGYNLGALCAVDLKPREFSAAQLAILDKFAALVVDEMELRTIAQCDFLTGAATRRAFTEAGRKAIDRFRNKRRTSALVLFDLDHFKRINDRYGHPSGDAVLQAVVVACNDVLRSGDAIGRLGGEEFGILLKDMDAEGAVAIAERLRTRIATLSFPWAPELRVTSSFGVASLQPGLAVEGWISLADEALYQAKRDGRDRIVRGDSLTPHPAAA